MRENVIFREKKVVQESGEKISAKIKSENREKKGRENVEKSSRENIIKK